MNQAAELLIVLKRSPDWTQQSYNNPKDQNDVDNKSKNNDKTTNENL
jgi:hypothetical protein